MKYTNADMEFDMDTYFMDVYIYNSDVFGLMTVYYNYFEVDLANIELEEETKKNILEQSSVTTRRTYIFKWGREK